MFNPLLISILIGAFSFAVRANVEAPLNEVCVNTLSQFRGVARHTGAGDLLIKACGMAKFLPGCNSVNGVPIYHFDKDGESAETSKRILVFSLIHGDEFPAGSVGRYWMERLTEISPRNTWRVVPVLNPDGLKLKTRTNANQVDLNRNFPTKDWDDEALKYWKLKSSNARRFPGSKGGSEPETVCALNQILDFKPDFVISIHTPLNVLDFDGPKVIFPKYNYLPWRSLGHFPGSLGRFMWFERQTPVLTIELKDTLPKKFTELDSLQDVIGTLVKLEISKPKN